MTNSIDSHQPDQLKYAREQVEKELYYRRDKQWKIFSWAGTILVAITGGTVALKTDPPTQFCFSWYLRAAIIASVVFLTTYAVLWVRQNLSIENDLQQAINAYDQKLSIESVSAKRKPKFGYTAALTLLAAAAIFAVVIP